MNQQPPILNIKMVPAGVELVLQALNKLPREVSDGLFREIAGQYDYQIRELQSKAEQAPDPQPSDLDDASLQAGGTD